jgi:hypothetical protein
MALSSAARAEQGRYLEAEAFLRSALSIEQPEPSVLWVDEALRAAAEDVLGRGFEPLRVRYWRHDGRTAWIFDEIGKELPITIGVSVRDGAIETVRVLEFRETRGWEVRHPFFTDQFIGARMKGPRQVDRSIDGITGATLSVGAVRRVVRLALLLSARVEQTHS